jgi:hypothetical protein
MAMRIRRKKKKKEEKERKKKDTACLGIPSQQAYNQELNPSVITFRHGQCRQKDKNLQFCHGGKMYSFCPLW